MTHFALDEDYFLLQNQPPTRAKFCAFTLLQRTHRPQNAPQRIFSRNSSPRENLARPPPGERFMGLRTSTNYQSDRPAPFHMSAFVSLSGYHSQFIHRISMELLQSVLRENTGRPHP